MNKNIILILIITLLFVIGCTEKPIVEESTLDDNTKMEDFVDNGEFETMSGGTKFIVDPADIKGGGPPKDGIPSIDHPNYVTIKEADEWIEDNELVLAIDYKGTKRVYPLQILVWHEIVNDKFNDERILITYCPLCGSGIAYIPEIEVDGVKKKVEFGTSGKLYNSNLVMYDRETDTYWQQIDGKAIVGDLVGQELEEISIDTVVWRDWKKVHPDSEVLSQKTGSIRNYGRDPYGSYYEDSFLIFPVDNEDDRLHPKDIVFGIEIDGEHKAYREVDLKETSEIKDNFAGKDLTISRDEAGVVKIEDSNGKEIVKERDMWFAWYAFHPETLLYEG
jgi:hypothetical protein